MNFWQRYTLNTDILMQIRPFQPTPEEYTAVIALRNTINPDNPSSVEIWQHWDDNRPADLVFERWVMVKEGALVGYGLMGETAVASGTFYLESHIHPAYQGGGLTARLYNHLQTRALTYQPQRLYANIRENQTQKLAWLSHHGFQMGKRYPVSHLNVTNFDPTPFAQLRARVAASGIQIIGLDALAPHDPLWQQRVHELDAALMQDVPSFEPQPPRTLAQFVVEEFEHPNFLPEGWLLALDASRAGSPYVGMSALVKQGGSVRRLATALTGVRRDYRRRGIATALKVAAIEVAQQAGTEIIVTGNEAHNPMYQINRQLGFVPQPAWLDWVKTLSDNP